MANLDPKGGNLFKNRKIQLILLAQCLLIAFFVFRLSGHDRVVEIPAKDLQCSVAEYDDELDGYHIEEASKYSGVFTTISGISLERGVYRVCAGYQTDTNEKNGCSVTDTAGTPGALLGNVMNFYSGLEVTNSVFWLLEDSDTLEINTTFSGTGSLNVKSITIYETNMLASIELFLVLCVLLLMDFFLFPFLMHKKKNLPLEQKNVRFILIMTILLASLPLFTDYLIQGGDLPYHLTRIEGMRTGILSGQFPVRIFPQWLCGHGYADSIYYGNTLLWIPTLFRLIGFPVQTSYKMFLFLINVATCLVAYLCYKNMFQSRYLGAFASVLTTLSVFRLYKMYYCAALGEFSASVFLPVLIFGFYLIFTQDITKPSYKKNWIITVVGFSGIIQTHILTCEMSAVFILLLCLILWKKVLRKATFIVLTKTVVITTFLNAWFILPFLDYTLSDNFVFMNTSARRIQDRGIYPAHLFYIFFGSGNTSMFRYSGMVNTEANGIGFSLFLGILLFLTVLILKEYKENLKSWIKTGVILLLFGSVACILSLSVFPWDHIQASNVVMEKLVSAIQFPTRFLTMAAAFIVALSCIGVFVLKKSNGTKIARIAVVVISGLHLFFAVYYMNSLLDDNPYYKLYDALSMSTGYVSGGEYLPYGTNGDQLLYNKPEAGDGVEITLYEKNNLTVDFHYQNHSGQDSYVDIPLLNYKGYQAKDIETNEIYEIRDGLNNVVRVLLPANTEGTVKVRFVVPWYWRMAEAVSLLTLIFTIFMAFSRNQNLKLESKEEHGTMYHDTRVQKS